MAPVVDAHLHVVSADTDRYPQQPTGFGRDWWTGRSVDVEQIGRDLDATGVDRGVIVQAVGPYRNDNSYSRAAVAGDRHRFALVAAIDAGGADPGSELAAVVDAGPVAAVRVFAAAGDASWLHDERGQAIWQVAASTGTSLVAALFPDHLDALAALGRRAAERHGRARPPRVPRSHRRRARTRTPARSCARGPGARPPEGDDDLARHAEPAGGTGALVQTLVDAFGADRIAWGSDHPQSYELPYAEMVGLATRRVRGPRRRGARGSARRNVDSSLVRRRLTCDRVLGTRSRSRTSPTGREPRDGLRRGRSGRGS